MKFLENIKENTLLIIDNSLKEKILEEINNYPKLLNIKIMTLTDFYKHYFYDYNKETLYYLINKYQITVSNALIYLDNMKYLINYNSNLSKIIYLKNMYQDLLNNNLLIIDNLFKDYLNTKNIIVLNVYDLDNFTKNIFDSLKATYYDLETHDYLNQIEVYNFKTIEEECSFIFNRISQLIKENVPINKIKLTNVTSEYYKFINRFSYLYNIKVNNLETNSIYGTLVVKNVLSLIKENKTKEEILDYLSYYKDKDIYSIIFNIINKYYFVDNLNLVYNLIEDDFKKANLKNITYQDGIDIIPLNSYLINQDNHVFLLGFNLENIPKTYKDIDYLNDLIKQEIGLFTSLEMNKLEHFNTLKHIKNIKNIIITYKDTDPYNSYYKSNLLDELNVIYKETSNINSTSNLYNQIKLTNNFDLMIKYGTKVDDTSILLNTYKELPYLTYDNKYKKIKHHLDKITLSYTSINNYYHCKFRYYIDNVLKLNIYEDTFKIFIGNLFHFILSKIFFSDFNFEYEFTNYLKNKNFNEKELFYLKLLKEELLNIIEIIKYQHFLSGLTSTKLETEISLKFKNHCFKGIVDKIMYKEKGNTTYLALIDYKTGTPKTNMTNLEYGIDMQLPIYLYLVNKSNLFKNPKLIGFYLQQILHEKGGYDLKKDYNLIKKDNLKLNGYSIDNQELVNMFDETYTNSEMIKGMKVTSKGFSHYTKVLNESEIDKIVEIVDLKIKEAFSSIEDMDFTINPKVINGENIGCTFCPYVDLCFKTGSDLVYLSKQENIVKEGELDANLDA